MGTNAARTRRRRGAGQGEQRQRTCWGRTAAGAAAWAVHQQRAQVRQRHVACWRKACGAPAADGPAAAITTKQHFCGGAAEAACRVDAAGVAYHITIGTGGGGLRRGRMHTIIRQADHGDVADAECLLHGRLGSGKRLGARRHHRASSLEALLRCRAHAHHHHPSPPPLCQAGWGPHLVVLGGVHGQQRWQRVLRLCAQAPRGSG